MSGKSPGWPIIVNRIVSIVTRIIGKVRKVNKIFRIVTQIVRRIIRIVRIVTKMIRKFIRMVRMVIMIVKLVMKMVRNVISMLCMMVGISIILMVKISYLYGHLESKEREAFIIKTGKISVQCP